MRPLFAILMLAPAASASDDEGPIPVALPSRTAPVSYAREIADVLSAKCVGCHNEALAENRLSLEDVPAMLKGGKGGPALIPGKADDSLMFRMAAHRLEPAMPPREKKDQKPLTPEELGLLKLWIDAGAGDDSDTVTEESPAPELGTLPPDVHPIVAVDLTADGRRVAAGRANVVHVYDADSGLEIVALGGHRDIVQSLRFAPGGRKLAAGSYRLVTVWDVPTGGPVARFAGHGGPVRGLGLLGDGRIVSGSEDRSVRIWTPDGAETVKLEVPAPVASLAVAPDGRSLALGMQDGKVHLIPIDPGQGERRALEGHAGAVVGLAFLDGGRTLVSASHDGTARVWDVATGATLSTLSAHNGPIHAVAAAADGSSIVTAGEDGTIRIWHAADGKLGRTIAVGSAPVLALAVDPSGRHLLAGTADGSARLIDPERPEPLATLAGHPGPVHAVAFSPSGDRCATAGAGGGVKVWEVADGRGVIAFGHLEPKAGEAKPIERVAFASDGSLVTASADGTLRSWAFEGRWAGPKVFEDHVFRVLTLDFNPAGTLLAAGGGEPSRSGEVKVWEVTKGFLVRSFDDLHSDTVYGVAFSADGERLATASADKFVKVVRLVGGAELRSFEGHTNHVLSVAWSPNDRQLVSGGADNVLKLWDFETGEQVRTMPGAGKQVTSVRWLGAGEGVAGASGDAKVRFWNSTNGQVTRALDGAGDFVFGVASSADGKRVAAGDASGLLVLWDGEDGRILRSLPAPAANP